MTQMLCTQTAYQLSLTTTIRRNGQTAWVIIPLVQLTTLAVWFLAVSHAVERYVFTTASIVQQLEVTFRCVAIIAKSVAFGLGVKPTGPKFIPPGGNSGTF